MRFLPAGLVVLALTACDAGSTAPLAPGESPSPGAGAPLRDALERIAPTLGLTPAAQALRSALAAAVEDASPAALVAIESALLDLEAGRPELAVEADVIRLAVASQR